MAGDTAVSIIQELGAGYFASRCLHAVVELGIADALGDEAVEIQQLATATRANADALARVLRLLESHGVFRFEGTAVAQTPASLLLRSDNPTSLRDFVRLFGLSFNWRSAERLTGTLMSGEAAAARVCEGGFWGHLAAHPDDARVFDAAMVAKSRGHVDPLLKSYDWSQFRHLVDVGGGQGHLLRAILRSNQGVEGTLFDLPHVVEAARSHGDAGGRLAFQGGDFFKDDLPTGDGYLLMEVIHDWADAEAAQIIAAVRRSSPAGAKLLVIETEVPEGPAPDWSKTLDIVMLTLFAARQRTAQQYRQLLAEQGFELQQAIDTGAGITIFEAG